MRSMAERAERAYMRMQGTHTDEMRAHMEIAQIPPVAWVEYERAGDEHTGPLGDTRWLHVEQVPMRERVYVCVEVGGGGCAVLVQRPGVDAYQLDYTGEEACVPTLDAMVALCDEQDAWVAEVEARSIDKAWAMLNGSVQVKVYEPATGTVRTIGGAR